MSPLHDADYGADKLTRKSRTGYLFFLNGSLISWQSKMQKTVSTSTAEAEYQAAAAAVKEALWLKRLINGLNSRGKIHTVNMKCDNQACIKMLNDVKSIQWRKHIDIAHHFVRERIMRREVQFKYCPTTEMLADFLTKPTSVQKFGASVKQIGLVQLPELTRNGTGPEGEY
eukprot:scaffold450_cov347-Pavlova_lutheri.AAC.1